VGGRAGGRLDRLGISYQTHRLVAVSLNEAFSFPITTVGDV